MKTKREKSARENGGVAKQQTDKHIHDKDTLLLRADLRKELHFTCLAVFAFFGNKHHCSQVLGANERAYPPRLKKRANPVK